MNGQGHPGGWSKEDFSIPDCPGHQARVDAALEGVPVRLLVGNSGAPGRAGAVRATHGRISHYAHLDMRWAVCPEASSLHPGGPGSIMRQIIVLDRSLELARVVGGITTDKKLKTATAGKLYKGIISTDLDGTPMWSVETVRVVGENEEPSKGGKEKPEKLPAWWQPWFLNPFGRTLAILSPLLLIIGLETTYQVSRRQNGLGTIGSNKYSQYTWAHLPTGLMLMVRIIYEGIFSSAKILQPYLHLKKGARIEDDAINDNPQAKLAVQSVWKGLSGNYGVALAALASIIAPLLTIVASGLYSAENIESARDIQIERADVFNSSISMVPFEGDTTGSNLIGGLIVTAGVAYPKWTHGELALSSLRIGSLADSKDHVTINASTIDSNHSITGAITTDPTVSRPSADDTSFLQTKVPAIRADLKCHPISKALLNLTTGETGSLSADVPGGCRKHNVMLPENTHVGGYFGTYQGPEFDGKSCPEVLFVFGYLPDKNTTDQIQAYACNTTIEILDANTKLLLPDYTITSADPIESSRQQLIPKYTPYEDFHGFLPVRNDTSKGYDEFWAAMMASNNVTTADFIQQPRKVLDAATHVLRVLLAQILSSQARVPLARTNDARPADADNRDLTLKGTLVDPNVTRVKQSAISSRILEAQLATMLIFCIIAFYFLRPRDLLPLNPCSIASAATYLAPSQLVGENLLPPDAGLRRESDLLGDSRLAGLMLSLGWWSYGGGKRYGIDIGKAE